MEQRKNAARVGLGLLLAAMMLGGALCGCESRSASGALPRQPQEALPDEEAVPASTEGEEAAPNPELEPMSPEELSVLQREHTVVSAEVQATASDRSWSTEDPMLAQNVYDLILAVNEVFEEPIEVRDRDYDLTFTTSEGETLEYDLWINFVRENEILVEDDQGNGWNLSLTDSDALRGILHTLN